MTFFEDGPAKGQNLMLKRAPRFLRIVEACGKWDALDQLDDKPEPREKIFAYERSGERGTVHINQGSGRGGWYTIAAYRVLADQPDDTVMRNNERWRQWCCEMTKAEEAKQ